MPRRGATARQARRERVAERREALRNARRSRNGEQKYRTPHTVDDMLAFAKELGWTWTRTSSGYRLLHPSGDTACLHLTTSDKAAWRNLRSQLLRPVREGRR